MMRTLLILIALQVTPLIAAEVVVCYQLLSDGEVQDVQQAREILKESDASRIRAYIATIQDTKLEDVFEFTYVQGTAPPEDTDQIKEPGLSIFGSFFTVNGGTRVRLDIREVKAIGIADDNSPRLHLSYRQNRVTLDKDGFGLLPKLKATGDIDAILIYFPQLVEIQKKANKAEMATPRKPSD